MRKHLFLFLALALAMPSAIQAQTPRDMWDFVNSFSCSTGRQHGVVYDGEYIYTSAWGKSSTVLSMFYKYDLNGNLIEEFDVPGIDNSDNYMRDMTYDGQYVYGCDAHSGTIWCYDLRNKSLVGQINTAFNELGTCTYDPENDAFWVGERATGSSPNLHLDDPNIIFDFAATPGWGYACSAGGAFIGECNGSIYFFGDVDKSPNLIGIYALGDYTPTPPTPPEGNIFFDFNDGIMQWTSIDADGDGYCWNMRRNWGYAENPYSVTSASYDDLTQTALHPQNYLVSPYKLDCEEITFIACAQDAEHPTEHFGVAVSTTGNTNADDFTIVWETDMTAKAAGFWYSYDVDLRAYQGQDIYVAIVHFNCSNQFMLNIDDVMLYRTYDNVTDNTPTVLSVYPNPSAGAVIIEGTGRLVVTNALGQQMLVRDIDDRTSLTLPIGLYFVRLENEKGVSVNKLVVK